MFFVNLLASGAACSRPITRIFARISFFAQIDKSVVLGSPMSETRDRSFAIQFLQTFGAGVEPMNTLRMNDERKTTDFQNRSHSGTGKKSAKAAKSGAERRIHRRHDMDTHSIQVERWDGEKRNAKPFGALSTSPPAGFVCGPRNRTSKPITRFVCVSSSRPTPGSARSSTPPPRIPSREGTGSAG